VEGAKSIPPLLVTRSAIRLTPFAPAPPSKFRSKTSKPRSKKKPEYRGTCRGTPAKFIDYVEAADAKTAEDIAAKEHRIPDTLRDRLVAIREEL
jgi:hypothetical protein